MKNHITDGSPCWCNPEMTYKDPINGAEVYVHKELQMSNEEIIKAVKNSLNIYSFTAEALEMLIDNVKKEATIRTKDPCNPLQDLTDDEIRSVITRAIKSKLFLGDVDIFRAVIAADRAKNNLCERTKCWEKNK